MLFSLVESYQCFLEVHASSHLQGRKDINKYSHPRKKGDLNLPVIYGWKQHLNSGVSVYCQGIADFKSLVPAGMAIKLKIMRH
jgi:hypothetical protein